MSTFDFEHKYQKWLDVFYEKHGYETTRIYGKDNEKYDVLLTKKDKTIKVEEKGATYFHKDIVIELIQDVQTNNWGWFFKTEAEAILYFYYHEEEPKVLYRVIVPYLRRYFKTEAEHNALRLGFTNKHYGLTLNAYAPWDKLVRQGVASQIWPMFQEQAHCINCGDIPVLKNGLCEHCYGTL